MSVPIYFLKGNEKPETTYSDVKAIYGPKGYVTQSLVMDRFLINGPCKIKGVINLSGSKNASTNFSCNNFFDEPVEIKKFTQCKRYKNNARSDKI